MASATSIKPITGMLRRNLIMDLGLGLAFGFGVANAFWYGYHMRRTNARDNYYAKLEQEKAEKRGLQA